MIYIYYNDGYYEMGDVGLARFQDLAHAENWLSDRIREHGSQVDNYTVIKGEEISTVVVETVARVKFQ